MTHFTRLLAPITLLFITGCTQAPPQPYADAYQAALERYPGTTRITPDMTARFVRFFSHDNNDGATTDTPALDPTELYGEPLYFSDTLLTTENRSAALQHLNRVRSGTRSLMVTVLDTQVDGQDVYLVWHMRATFAPVRSPVTSTTLGMSHLRFDDTGRIIFQQDFWDSAEGLYRHVPVLGFLIDSIQGRFSRHDR